MTPSATEAPSEVNMEFARKALIHATAIENLVGAGCTDCLGLFATYAENRLRLELETGEIYVVDERGAKRHGVSPKDLAQEIWSEFDAPNPGRFFRKRK